MSLPKNTVNVSIQLDLSEFPGYCPKDKDEIPGSLQNLGSFFSELRSHYLEQVFLWGSKSEPMSEDMVKHFQMKAKLAEQIFNQYRVEGSTTDGTQFVFTHEEPSYRESLTYPSEAESAK